MVQFGKVLCFAYSDGSVEYRDRFTMAEMYREVNLERINSVLDVGFSQSGEPLCKFHCRMLSFYTNGLVSQAFKWLSRRQISR